MEFVKTQLKGFSRFEIIFFVFAVFLMAVVSFCMNDSKIALISAVCGTGYTILAGKGKVLCYFAGITGTLCYCYIAFKNGFYGNLALWGLYYLPMEIIGIFKWQKHINKKDGGIYKTRLTLNESIVYCAMSICGAFILGGTLAEIGGARPFIDGFTTVFSILGQLLTVKRCIEQWYVWFFVNLLSLLMWVFAWLDDSGCSVMVIMWGSYLFLSVYFLKIWQRELAADSVFTG